MFKIKDLFYSGKTKKLDWKIFGWVMLFLVSNYWFVKIDKKLKCSQWRVYTLSPKISRTRHGMNLKFTPVIVPDNWSTKMVSFFLPPASYAFYRPKMAEITKLNNFSSTKGSNLKLKPVTDLDKRGRMMTSSEVQFTDQNLFFNIWSVK